MRQAPAPASGRRPCRPSRSRSSRSGASAREPRRHPMYRRRAAPCRQARSSTRRCAASPDTQGPPLGMRVELFAHAREPSRVPSIMVAHPRKCTGAWILALRDLDDFPPCRHHALALLVPEVSARGHRAARSRAQSPRRSSLDPSSSISRTEVTVGLREDRVGRLAQMRRVVAQGSRPARCAGSGHATFGCQTCALSARLVFSHTCMDDRGPPF